jgi:hypothetical protein
MLANAGQEEKFAERPAHPEVLLHAHRLQTHRFIDLLKGKKTAGKGKLEKGVHGLC